MSFVSAKEPRCHKRDNHIELIIEPRERSLGGLNVRRVLPARDRRTVGPFVFFDQMGPATFPPDQGIQVRPHPHIGLATVTYLFEGTLVHRDSLGSEQTIRPGAINLMVAGRGIVHSERAEIPADPPRLHGIQTWIALPDHLEDSAPTFQHYGAESLPRFRNDGVDHALLMGSVNGHESPVTTFSPTLYLECRLPCGARLTLPNHVAERAVYVVTGEISSGHQQFGRYTMAVFRPGCEAELVANEDSHLLVIGGDPVGERHVWWNFVASDRAKIEDAKARWREGGFDAVPGDDEFIPLPE